MTIFGQSINESVGSLIVNAVDVAGVAIAAGIPVHVYTTSTGITRCAVAAVDGSTKRGTWGVTIAAIASGGTGPVCVKGLVGGLTGGTADQMVTSITAAGTITDAAAASANTDLALGVSYSATQLVIY